MQKIIPHLWFDTQAKDAAKFYSSIFPDSKNAFVKSLTMSIKEGFMEVGVKRHR